MPLLTPRPSCAPPAAARRALPRSGACGAGLLALASLAGCADQGEKFAPPCPVPSIPRDFNEVQRYRGAGRDLTDLVLQGRITAVNGACTRDGPETVVVTISTSMELTRGPAARERTAQVEYFVAVSLGTETILDKQVYPVKVEFPPNTDRLRLTGDEVELRLPVSAKRPSTAYRVSVGFQLTPAELERNRARAP